MTAPKDTVELSANDLRAEQNLLVRFAADAEASGLVGEKKNAQMILLAAVSARLEKPINVSV